MLGRKGQSLKDVVRTLKIFRDNIDVTPDVSTGDDSHQAPSQKEVLEVLITTLDASDVG